ncbi:hypothetical protein V9T40_000789 [Parthenolecanium corni]|uniref:Uncharacterized protein n=1 Tax=Parthenolecanium corni TaxID=536013 RepID=A0AAN9TCA1_9HEMI
MDVDEKDIKWMISANRRTEQEFNVPQPLATYLQAIGHVEEKRGKLLYLADHTLPVVVAGDKGGYHSLLINTETHNLYKEIPTLGVTGDVLMATTGPDNTVPTLPILPNDTAATQNLLGFPGATGSTGQEQEFNVPQPLATYLQAIGHVEEKRGKLLYLANHTLPVVVAGDKGGYHSLLINTETHNLYKEIPTLGVTGDVLMATTGPDNTVPTLPILPNDTAATQNLLGFPGATGSTRQEQEFNVPQPLATYLQAIGHVEEKRGKLLYLANHTLPVVVAGDKGGYHSLLINTETHNLYKEIQMLGVTGDVLMATTGLDNTVPTLPILPNDTAATQNLLGFPGATGSTRQEQEFNVPQPLATYLQAIGHVEEKRGKLLYLADHTLPVVVAGDKGGYHSLLINTETHNLYKEIPTLGVTGDVLMATTGPDNTVPTLPILPNDTAVTQNLLGFPGATGSTGQEQEFNVPQPLATYLQAIGHVEEKRGKLLYLANHTLPVVVAGDKGGYHSLLINTETHNLYKEIPTLGVTGDVLMATTGPDNTVPTLPILPNDTAATQNLLGFPGATGSTRQEQEFNVPQPLATYLQAIGHVEEKRGKLLYLANHTLPVVVAGDKGGYHSLLINTETHNLYKEIPMLGVTGDVLMATTGLDNTVPTLPILPNDTAATQNLLGFPGATGSTRQEQEFNVPQPLATYLQAIGHVEEKRGKLLYLANHTLPVVVAGDKGGYHSLLINTETHNLYKEIPTLGVTGDVLMATTGPDNTVPTLPILPNDTAATQNLLGFPGATGSTGQEQEFNVPQPLATYLQAIGHVEEKRGKLLYLANHTLPVVVAGDKGGYHSLLINTETHNLYKEIPTLGVTGDVLMATTGPDNTVPTLPILPNDTAATQNLLGFPGATGSTRQEQEFNVPQPLATYLQAIGHVEEKRGKLLYLANHTLPVVVAGDKGGYHSLLINTETHNLYKEIPMLGVTGDVLMATTGLDNTVPTLPILPNDTAATQNLLGFPGATGSTRQEQEFNVPQPLATYLQAIGHVEEKRGKLLYLANHTLPVVVAGDKGGYHSLLINTETHNLYKEIPMLGVTGDVLMATTGLDNTVPTLPILPNDTVATQNLLGFPGATGSTRQEQEFNVPQPLATYLQAIGHVEEKRGKLLYLADHTLPVVVAGDKGGYHSLLINTETHNLYKEIPTLGVTGDVLMATTGPDNTVPTLPILPNDTAATQNLLGFPGATGSTGQEQEFNVPQPLATYLQAIGHVEEKRGKLLYLANHTLPVVVAGDKGGYHSLLINTETHNLYKEIPTLGVTGDVLMATTGPDNTVPTLPILPNDTAATQNLLGFPGATGSTRQEQEFNVPQPLATYLQAIGHVEEKRGKLLYLANHTLPVVVAGDKGGYHSLLINTETHNLYKEIPMLGVTGDVLMATTGLDNTVPTLPILPNDTAATQNLLGFPGATGSTRQEQEFNVPQPLATYLQAIGHVEEKRGKLLYLADHTLPVVVAGDKGGYHSLLINTETHNLYKEIPTLGVTGDVLMATTGPDNTVPTLPILPNDTAATQNLLGFPGATGSTGQEQEFNVPQPLATYLQAIGHVEEKRGKLLYLANHTLPVVVAGDKGGYHSLLINTETHNLYKEIPTLGVTGDVLMATTGPDNTVPTLPILPNDTAATQNLLGFPGATGSTRQEQEFNVPQPLATYLQAIGHVEEKRGKLLYLANHTLPVVVAGDKGGYHSLLINTETHNLYKEIPMLGVTGDVLMATTGLDNTVPTLPILPNDTAATQNLLGFPGATGSTRQEVKQILNSDSKHFRTTAFPETVTNTRFNLQLMLNISAILSEFGTFRSDKLVIPNMTVAGSDAELIRTDPQGGQNLADTRWVDAVVQPSTVANTSLNSIGATYFAGFQLVKRNFGTAMLPNYLNWVCLTGTAGHPWNIPAGWVNNCNDRRALPQNYEHAQFAALYDSQSFRTIKVIERMVKKQSSKSVLWQLHKSELLL